MFTRLLRSKSNNTTVMTTRTRLGVEVLEAREVPAVYKWIGATENWATAANWELGGVQSATVPGANDTVQFVTGSAAKVAIPDGTKVAVAELQTGYTGTLTLAGTFEVTSSVTQKSGTISEGVFTFSGTEYLWTGGVRVGTGANSNTEAFTVIGTQSNLRLPSIKSIEIEGATVQIEGTATYNNNDAPGAGPTDVGTVSLGKTGRFVVDGIYHASLVKEGDGKLIFEDDKKFGESQVIINGSVYLNEGKVSVNADFNLKPGGLVKVVGAGQTQPLLFEVGGASVSSGLYHIIGKTASVNFTPSLARTDNPVLQFNGSNDVVTAIGTGRFGIGGDGLVKLNGWVALYSAEFTTHAGTPSFVPVNAQGDMIVTSADTKVTFLYGLDLATEWVNRGSAILGKSVVAVTDIRQGGKIRNLGTVNWESGDIRLSYENNANGDVVIENANGATFTIGDHAKKITKANGQQGTAILLNEGTLVKDPNAPKVKHDLSGIHYQDKAGAKCKQNGSEFDWGNGNPPKAINGDYALGDGGKVNFGESLTIGATGILTGHGTVTATQVFNYGVIAPGEDVAVGAWDGSLLTHNLTIIDSLTFGSTGVASLGWRNGQAVTDVDTLTILGDLIFSGRQAVLDLVGEPAVLSTSQAYTLFTFTGTRWGWFGTIAGIPTDWEFYYDPQTGVLRTTPPGGGGGGGVIPIDTTTI